MLKSAIPCLLYIPADFEIESATISTDEPPELEDPTTRNNDLFEGDIILPHWSPGQDDLQYNAIRNSFSQWPSGKIPYTLSSSFSPLDRFKIAGAIRELQEKTCLRFVPRSGQEDYVYIGPGTGCSSMVGRMGGRQQVSLDDGCLYHGVIVHELVHVSGFFHEQSRADRDNFIEVHYDNVAEGASGQFRKQSLFRADDLGTEYDYGSVMHYGRYAFSRNGQPTISKMKSGPRIGQRKRLSDADAVKINKLYGCHPDSGGKSTNSVKCEDACSASFSKLCHYNFVRKACPYTSMCITGPGRTISKMKSGPRIGQRKRLSDADAVKINKLYGCHPDSGGKSINSVKCEDACSASFSKLCHFNFVRKACPNTCKAC